MQMRKMRTSRVERPCEHLKLEATNSIRCIKDSEAHFKKSSKAQSMW